jgi:hypothetical protein
MGDHSRNSRRRLVLSFQPEICFCQKWGAVVGFRAVQSDSTIHHRRQRFSTWPTKLDWRLLALCVVLIIGPTAYAVRMVPLSISQLTAKAQLVLQGTVISKTVQRDAEGRIYTRIELQVADVWKGPLNAKAFTLVQSGGTLGEEIVTVDGQEEFSIGEEVVLFLVLNQRNEGVVIGLSQGKFKVRKEPGGEKVVQNLFHGTAPETTKTTFSRLSLTQLKQRVQEARP